MPKKNVAAKNAPAKKVNKPLAKSIARVKAAVYRSKDTQPRNII